MASLTVHHRLTRDDERAPCGYKYRAKMFGLDYSTYFTRSDTKPFPVTCQACIDAAARRPEPRGLPSVPLRAKKTPAA
jgi:hypothetical protein